MGKPVFYPTFEKYIDIYIVTNIKNKQVIIEFFVEIFKIILNVSRKKSMGQPVFYPSPIFL